MMYAFRSLLALLFMGFMLSSCTVRLMSNVFSNIENDDHDPVATLTSLALGYERFNFCDFDTRDRDWYCTGPYVSQKQWAKAANWPHSELTTSIAKEMYWPIELLIFLALVVIVAPRTPEETIRKSR